MKQISLLQLVLLAVVPLWSTSSVQAQGLSGCASLNNTIGSKIVFSRVEYERSNGDRQVLTEELGMDIQFNLKEKIDNMFPTEMLKPKWVLCENRSPRIDGSDFTDDYIAALVGREVLVEIWGEIKERTQDDSHLFGAGLYIMVIPVRHYERSSGIDFHLIRFPFKERGNLAEALKEMTLGVEFTVCTYIAQGIKVLKNHEFERSKKYIASARQLWEEALSNQNIAQTLPDSQQVLDFICELEDRIIKEAALSGSYTGDVVAVHEALKEREQ